MCAPDIYAVVKKELSADGTVELRVVANDDTRLLWEIFKTDDLGPWVKEPNGSFDDWELNLGSCFGFQKYALPFVCACAHGVEGFME